MALAAFAAFCFIAPPAVMAFGHGKDAVHCLTQADAVNHGMAGAGNAEHRGDHAPAPGSHQSSCCGLFCLSALTVSGGALLEASCIGLSPSPSPEQGFLGQTPECPDPPPISPLAV